MFAKKYCTFFYVLFVFYPILIVSVSVPGCTTPAFTLANEPKIVAVQSKTLIPEGIAVHPLTGTIYLSSLHENKIVTVDKNGDCTDLVKAGQDGFMKGLGIKISNDGKSLWACTASLDTTKSSSGLFQFDLASGKTLRSYLHKSDSPSLFNDLAIDSKGAIYLTDTYQSTVFRYDPVSNTLQPWLSNEKISFPNGIAFSPDERILFVASGNKGVQRIDMQTKDITPVTKGSRTDYAIDGLLYSNRSLIGVIGWPQDKPSTHRVIRYRLSDDQYLTSVDTIAINKSYLLAPTTAAIHNKQLYFLAKTNLGFYNKGGQDVEKVRDSLEFPLVVQVPL